MWAGGGGRTVARVVALAVLEDPPNPAVRWVPFNVKGRAARSRAHALSGQPPARHCPDHAVDGNRVACARGRTREQPNARANDSSSCENRGDMRSSPERGRIEGQHYRFLQRSWRSKAGKDEVKVVVRSFTRPGTCERASWDAMSCAPSRARRVELLDTKVQIVMSEFEHLRTSVMVS